jgi:galactokinase
MFVDCDVPPGSGLSSSAALDVALLRALRTAFELPIDDVRLAILGQRVENRFVGAQVGVMDPMACSLAEEGSALFIDTRSLSYESVRFPRGAEMVVINSGVAHQHAGCDYNTRRSECERACRHFGVSQLRDLNATQVARLGELPAPLDRRVRHVVTENARVLKAVAAMRADDPETLGQLFYASHESQRDDYEVSVKEIDLLVDLARAEKDVFGARLTGGGFGGSIVLLARTGTGKQVAQRVTGRYAERTGKNPTIVVPS